MKMQILLHRYSSEKKKKKNQIHLTLIGRKQKNLSTFSPQMLLQLDNFIMISS